MRSQSASSSHFEVQLEEVLAGSQGGATQRTIADDIDGCDEGKKEPEKQRDCAHSQTQAV